MRGGKRLKKNSNFLILEFYSIIAVTLIVVTVMISLFVYNNQPKQIYSEPIGPEYEHLAQDRRKMPELTEEELEHIIERTLVLYSPYGVEPRDSFPLSDSDRHYIECIVAGESGAEPHKGQIAVAECIRNGIEAGGVNYTPQQLRADSGYSGWKDNPEKYTGVKEAVSEVFDLGVRTTEKSIRWFYAPDLVQSKWHENELEFVEEIGGHRFFCEKEN